MEARDMEARDMEALVAAVCGEAVIESAALELRARMASPTSIVRPVTTAVDPTANSIVNTTASQGCVKSFSLHLMALLRTALLASMEDADPEKLVVYAAALRALYSDDGFMTTPANAADVLRHVVNAVCTGHALAQIVDAMLLHRDGPNTPPANDAEHLAQAAKRARKQR